MTHLGRSIDKLELDSLQVLSAGVLHQRLSKNQRSLLNSDNGSLQHDPVLIDLTIMNESSHRGDSLNGKVSLGLTTGLVVLLSDAVNLLVEFGTVEVSILTSTGNSGGDTGRVPRSDTCDLSQTTVSLSGKTADTPTSDDTFVSATLGNTDNINVLVLAKDRVDRDLLLEQALGKVDLGSSVSSVDLDLHNVGLLQSEVEQLDLGVGDNTNNSAELLDALKLGLNVLSALLGVFLGVLGEGLFLASVPVLVKTTLEFFVQVLRENSSQGTETKRGLNVTNNTHNDHGRSLDDRDGIDNFALVHEGTSTVDAADNVGHTGLVSTEGGEVRSLRGVVMGEGADATRMVLGALLGEETQVSLTGSFKLAVRPTKLTKRRAK